MLLSTRPSLLALAHRSCGQGAGRDTPAAAPSPWRRHCQRRRLPACRAQRRFVPAAGEVAELRAALAEAVGEEDFARAAALRDQIADLEQQDPEAVLRAELQRAVNEERYEDAALLKQKLQEVQAAAGAAVGELVRSPTTSEAVTEGVRVTAQSFFVPGASHPEREEYLFAYHMTIKNDSQRTVKIVERFFEVTNDRGQIHETRGEGVVGRQPELAPGQSFFFQATTPLSTPQGAMKGHFEMYVKNEASGKWTQSFLANIGAFGLDGTE